MGVRRTAEIFLFDADDYESMFAKYGINGIWDNVDPNTGDVTKTAEDKHQEVMKAYKDSSGEVPEWLANLPLRQAGVRNINHRRMSNNSVAFEKKPSREHLSLIFAMMKNEGDPKLNWAL